MPGLQLTVVSDSQTALRSAPALKPDVVLMELSPGSDSDLEGLLRLRSLDRRLPIVIISSSDRIKLATEAIRLGAYDYLIKPIDIPKIEEVVLAALESVKAMREVVTFEPSAELGPALCWIGRNPRMLRVFEMLNIAASSDGLVLIVGSSGSGKRLLARAIYQQSERSQQAFRCVNCAEISEKLVESQLFGNSSQAFNPFFVERIGLLEQYDQGTILLHEIDTLPLPLQTKLVLFFRTGAFQPLGRNQERRVNVRLIATSSKWVDPAVIPPQLEPSLLRMPGVTVIRLPGLRDRKEDIRPLAQHFLQEISREFCRTPKVLSAKAMAVLETYYWPGSIRELRDVIRSAFMAARGDPILPVDLPSHLRPFGESQDEHCSPPELHASRKSPPRGSESVAAMARKLFLWARSDSHLKIMSAIERELVINALVETKGNQVHAAKLLGMTRATLRKRVARFRIEQELSFG